MAKDITKGLFGGKGNGTVESVISLVLIVTLIFVIVKVFKALKTTGAAVGDILGEQTTSVETGIPVARLKVLQEAATDINSYVHRYFFTNTVFWMNEDGVVAGCNKAQSDKEAIMISRYFRQNTGQSLRTDIIENRGEMSDKNRNRILFRTSFT